MSEYNTTPHPFRPVKCLEADLENLSPVEGYVLFTTDTNKIYICHDGEFKMMGGSSGVYYGSRQLTDDEKYGEEVFFNFTSEEIDGDQDPAVDDLILNIPDGGFYRVLEADDEVIQTQRLVIAGGGGGGGGGSTPGISNEGSLEVKFITPQYSTVLSGEEYYIEYEIVAKDSAGDPIMEEGLATWKINGKTYTQTCYNGVENKFRVDEYLDHNVDKNKIILVVSMPTGGSKNSIVSKTWYVTAVNLRLEWPWTYSKEEYRNNDTFTLNFTPYGNVDCTAHIVFDNSFEEGVTYFKEEIPASKTGRAYTTNPMPSLSYGPHTCQIYLEATINGEPQETRPVENVITFTKGSNSTILTVPFKNTTVSQYDTVNIPFLVFDPDTDVCKVSFLVNDVPIGDEGQEYDQSLHYWPYTVVDYGTVKLTIKTDNEDAAVDIELIVNKMDLGISEASGPAFSLKATNFSSNSELINWSQNGVNLRFSENFDWNRGGINFETLEDGSVEKFIRVRQGTRMWINYKLFENFTTGTSGGKTFKFCFKATNCYDYEAPVMNCMSYKYEPVTVTSDKYSTYKYYTRDTVTNEYVLEKGDYRAGAAYFEKLPNDTGLIFDAQKAVFRTSAYPTFATQYCENSYVEVETEIWPKVGDTVISDNSTIYGDRFLMFWVDGVPAGVKPYSETMSLTQTSPQYIEIGSDLCDVLVYCAKAYERRLSLDEHLDNFIMDAPSAQKMLDRFRRNDIVDNRGEISYEKLVANNPECHAYLYEIPYLTTSKNDKVDGCTYYELIGEHNTLDKPFMKGEKVRTYVQGTSSAAYGVAAFNLRSDFTKKGTIYDKDGNEMEGWKISDIDLPIDIACTKVNVASCENANNVVNAEWYNRFQPYWDAHRRKGYAVDSDGNELYNPYRDCMKFHSGVIFIKDNNKELNYLNANGEPDTALCLKANTFLTKDYVDAPFFKMYAIGNMGNDKKNLNVFHDITNPRAACVEVADNQNAEHWMTIINEDAFEEKVIGQDAEGKDITEGPFYEFRYGVVENDDMKDNEQGVTEASQREDFMRFVRWMAHNDPSPYDEELHPFGYTGELLVDETGNPAPVTFDEDFEFQGFIPPGCSGPSPSGITLAGQKITKYKKTYTHDTKEYRIAKMLYECEDYLVMDSVMFHYLYILRHTMVDNVAKNTFWSTEDGLHWDLTKNYDNDTSDGNDNTGNLTYTYGLEYGDLNADGKDVFNASPSVWITFVNELTDAQKYLYNELEKKGAWQATPYLNEFKKHQDVIPERCWIADYERKYLRPRKLGLDEKTYLDRLEGGRKTHQRTQFETYQEFYMNSKYVAGTPFTDGASLEFRLNKNPSESWDPNNVLPISFYIDCYATIHLGGQKKTSGRLKRKQIYNAPVGTMVEAPSDATCYVYGAGMIQSMSGFDRLYPGYAKLNGASKLLSVELGSNDPGYYNARLTKVDAGSNTMLQKFQMRNSGTIEGNNAFGSLILNRANRLNEIYLSGSAVKELSLADGASTEIMELNPLKILNLSNLLDLRTITVDDTAEKSIYNTIEELYVKNCPAFDSYTYKMAKRPQLKRYQLNDFHWTIETDSQTYNPADDFALDANGNVTGILAVDNLNDSDTIPKDGSTKKTALTGLITINVPCKVNEFDLYKKYIKTFPGLVIEYGNNVGSGYTEAVELVFMKNEISNEQHYRVLSSGSPTGESVGALISAAGPTGEAIKAPNRESTSTTVYTFTGYWATTPNPGEGDTLYYIDGLEDPSENAVNFNTVIPTDNTVYYPVFNSDVRRHTVKFHDYEGNVIESFGVPYGMTYKAAGGTLTNFYYLDSSNLPSSQRYGFQGWTTTKYEAGKGKNVEYIDINTYAIKGPINLYPYYIIEDVESVASTQYFTVENGAVVLKEEFANSIRGKITIPDLAGATSVGTLRSATGITHIYFLKNSNQYTSIGMQAFMGCTGLTSIRLPNSIKTIGESAFEEAYNLKDINLHNNITRIEDRAFAKIGIDKNDSGSYTMQITINELPPNLEYLGSQAFYQGGPNVIITKIPQKITTIYYGTFAFCENVKVSNFGSRDGSTSQLTDIGDSAFLQAGIGSKGANVTAVYIYKTISTIGANAFSGYAINTLTAVYFAKGESDYGGTTSTQMGFPPISSEAGFNIGYNAQDSVFPVG